MSNESTDRAGPLGSFSVFVDRHGVVVYFCVLLALSWPYLFLTLGMGESLTRMLPYALFGPSMAAFLTAFAARGVGGTRELFAGILKWRAPPTFYLLAVFGIPLCYFPAAYALTALLYPGELAPPPVGALIVSPINFVLIFVFAGLGEEFGWRGLALPRMQGSMGPLWASLVLGLMWSAWHLPLGVASADSDWLVSKGIFFVSVTAATFFYTWLFNGTGGSVLIVALLHTAENTWATPYEATFGFEPPGFLFFDAIRAVAWVIVALAIAVLTRGSLGYSRQNNGKTRAPRDV